MQAIASIGQRIAPLGTLTVAEDGTVSAFVRTNLRTAERVTAAVNAAAGLSHRPFLPCGGAQRTEQGFSLVWPARAATRQSLESLAQAWREAPARHVADMLAAAACVSRAIGELQHLAPSRFLLSPAQVFLETSADGLQSWGVVPLPIDSARFRDMATASPSLTEWLGGADVFGRDEPDRVHMLGAVLYHCLVGDTYGPATSRVRQLQRLISYRAGNAARLRMVLDAAIPASLAKAGQNLFGFIVEALGPSLGRRLTATQAAATLQRLQTALSAPLLAGAWETAGMPELALEILESHARIAPADDVPWPTLARLRGRSGRRRRPDGPDEPAGDSVPSPLFAGTERSTIAKVRAAADLGPQGREQLAALLAELRGPAAPPLAEHEYLYLAYAEARWLGATAEAIERLSRRFTVSWNSAVRALLLARLHADRGGWVRVGINCRDCVDLIQAMPDRGSERGSYAMAYALLLDARAHMAVVADGHLPEYLEDAWSRLVRARPLVRANSFAPLGAELETQIAALRRQVDRFPQLAKLGSEIDSAQAGMTVMRLGDEASDEASRAGLPWPDDRWLFSA